MTLRWLAVIAFLLPLMIGSHPSAAQPVTTTQDLDALKQHIQAILQRTGVPGVGIAIANRDGVLWAGGIGYADVASQRPVTADTVFRLGSVTKNITAMLVMREVEQGRLSLDDRVRDLAPDAPFSNRWETTNPVRISNLLEHTAGFDFVRFNDDMDPQLPGRSIADALAVNPAARESRWLPGTRVAYSNEGYTLAAYVLEQLTHEHFDDLVRSEVFAPLGMSSSAMVYDPRLVPQLATGYDSSGLPQEYVEDMQRPAANMMASTNDMAAYLLMLLRGGALPDGSGFISAADFSRMQERRTLPYAGPAEQYGLGTETAQYDAGFVGRGHVGSQLGFRASLRYFPDQGVGWIVMANQITADEAINEIETELLNFTLSGKSASAPSSATYPSPQLLTGYYRNAASDSEARAELEDVFGGTDVELRQDGLWERDRAVGGLRSVFTSGTWQHIVPTDPNGSFRLDDETIASRVFVQPDGGPAVLVTQMGYFEKANQFVAEARRRLMQLALLLLTSGLVFVPLAIMRGRGMDLPGPLSGLPGLAVLITAALQTLIALTTWLVLMRTNESLGNMNASSVWAFVASIALPLLAVLTLGLAARQLSDPSVGLVYRLYLFAFGMAGGCLTLLALAAHWVALRTWAF